ncbi:MAG: LPXTG cell wall anchor domain-containing protein, partial [Chloroflexota bacterium]
VSSQTNLPAFTLNPGQYYLIAEGFGANGLSPLPIVPDVTGTIAMAATAGKVFLVGNTAALTLDGTGCPTSLATVIDFVGYGTSANCSEGGSPAPAPSTITSAIRRLRGCQDTDVNGTDFVASVPNPRNSGMTIPCSSPYPNPTGSPNPTPTGSPYPTLVRLVSADASRDDGMPFALGAVGVAALLGGGVWFLRQKRRK